ncbi:MAG: Holliday junction resolvase RuvX [Bacillota bacterium]|nr:Holliday junction resolvase RuvX [Bacillota bacterium]
MRIMGVDFGDARTGIAMSDINGFLASPLVTIYENGLTRTAEEVARLAAEHSVKKIVVGLPKNMDGSSGSRVEKTYLFCEELKKRFTGEIITSDERRTTVYASNILNETNTRGKKRKQSIDQLAAVLILQTYLDSTKL